MELHLINAISGEIDQGETARMLDLKLEEFKRMTLQKLYTVTTNNSVGSSAIGVSKISNLMSQKVVELPSSIPQVVLSEYG